MVNDTQKYLAIQFIQNFDRKCLIKYVEFFATVKLNYTKRPLRYIRRTRNLFLFCGFLNNIYLNMKQKSNQGIWNRAVNFAVKLLYHWAT